ncbi:para-aminobenzoate synthase, subunit I [Meredithblackwellia eburnea MCA 4105]
MSQRQTQVKALIAKQLASADPSTIAFLRAYGLGFAASTVPSFLRLVIGLILGRKGSRQSILKVLTRLLEIVVKGLNPRGLAMASGISLGGAKWGEERLEPLVRRTMEGLLLRLRQMKGKRADLEKGKEEGIKEGRVSDEAVKRVSTFFSGAIASLVAISVLQSSPEYQRAPVGSKNLSVDPSPYPSVLDDDSSGASTPNTLHGSGPPDKPLATQSATLDLTLFLLVRAVDTLARWIYEFTGPAHGKAGVVVDFLASQSDTLIFWLSCWRIMWCWFYLPERLYPSYRLWISRLARMDTRLLQLLQFARNGEYVYGQEPKKAVADMSAGIASAMGRDPSMVNPHHLTRLDCLFVHGHLGGPGGCESNAAKRWFRAFLDAMAIYLPVHFIPHLLFNLRGLAGQPLFLLPKIILAASRSSAFLATFVATIYASVCLVRTRLPQAFPFIPQQPLDSGLCTALGCFLCGFSVIIEKKHRRREMALFCAPRALYAVMDEIVPTFLTKGRAGDFLSKWLERIIFAASTGTVLSATVHRPDLVSGIMRGIMVTAVGDWGKPKKALK